mgnify:CR=1 FL=1
MTTDEIVERITGRHFKRLESKLIELKLPRLVYMTISKEFRFLEQDLKKALSFEGEDLTNILTED